jgi:hypothetical protein
LSPQNCQELIQTLISKNAAKEFIKRVGANPKYYIPQHLTLKRNQKFLDEIGFPSTERKLENLAKQFRLDSNLKTHFYLMSDKREESLHTFLVGVVTNRKDFAPLGYFAIKFKRNVDGDLESEVDGIYFDPENIDVPQKAATLLQFLKDNLYDSLQVKREILKADYLGRYVWARLGFQFNPTKRFINDQKEKDRKTIFIIEMVQRNLARFLTLHKISKSDLILNKKPVSSLDQLTKPSDFADLKHKAGKQISVQPYIAFQTFGEPQLMDIGKAFMVSDYNPAETGTITSQGRTNFSATAMPYWDGYRDVQP